MVWAIISMALCVLNAEERTDRFVHVAPNETYGAETARETPRVAVGPAEFDIDPPAPARDIGISVADFGADPEADDNSAAFAAAIAHARTSGASRLTLPPGTYRFDTDDSLLFEDLTDLTIAGNGARLLFYHPGKRHALITLRNLERVRIHDLTIDWDWDRSALASVVKVDRTDPDGLYFDLRFLTSDPARRIVAGSINPLNPDTLAAGVPDAQEFGMWIIKEQEWVGPDLLRLWYRDEMPHAMEPRHVGRLYSARHYTYDMHAVHYMGLRHVAFENVAIHGAPGAGFVGADDSHHLHFLRCRVTRPPDSDRIISVTADHCMIRNALGYVKIEDCEFGWGGDDGINIHPANHMGIERVDAFTVLAKDVSWATPFAAGDVVEFRNSDLSPTGFTTQLVACERAEGRDVLLTLAQAAPSHVAEDSILFNHRWGTHSYIIRNCRFHHNRARGVLAQSRNGVIEGCTFEHTQGPAIQIECGSEERWSEGFGVQNLLIRNNRFINCNTNAWLPEAHRPLIYISVYLPCGRTTFPIFDGITIEANRFETFPGAAVFASSMRNLTVRANAFANALPFAREVPHSGAVYVERALDVCITDNAWEADGVWNAPGAVIDADTTAGIRVEGNRVK